MGKRMDDETRAAIVTDAYVYGVPNTIIAKNRGVSYPSVCAVIQVFDMVKGGKWVELAEKAVSRQFGMNLIFWAITSLGANPPKCWMQQTESAIASKRDEKRNGKDEPLKSEPPKTEPTTIAPEEPPKGAKIHIPAPSAEVGWQTRIKVNPGRVCMTVYFNGVPTVEGYSKIRGDKELDLMQAVSYAAHMCYKIVEQRKLGGR